MADPSRAFMAEGGDVELINRFRAVGRRVPVARLVADFGLSERTVNRYMKPGYYPTRRITGEKRLLLERCVDALEAEFGVTRHDPRDRLRRLVPGQLKAGDIMALEPNRGHELIGRIYEEGPHERPDLITVIETASASDWTAEELRTVLRWVGKQLRAKVEIELTPEERVKAAAEGVSRARQHQQEIGRGDLPAVPGPRDDASGAK